MKKFMSREHADVLTRYHMGKALGYGIMTSLYYPNIDADKKPTAERAVNLNKSRSRNRNP